MPKTMRTLHARWADGTQRLTAWRHVRMQAGDYKTGRAYGERPPMVIAPAIYPEVRFLVFERGMDF